MDRVLGGLKWSSCSVYFVVGRTFKHHLHHLIKVLHGSVEGGRAQTEAYEV